MKRLHIIILTVVLIVTETYQQCFTPFTDSQPNIHTHMDLYSGQQDFSLGLLNAINKVMPGENFFFSPYSTYHALLIAYFIAGGKTESYIKKVLRFNNNQNKSDIYAAYNTEKFMTQFIAANASYQFNGANKIYVSDQLTVRDCVVNDFPHELETFPFQSNPENSRLAINQWVENITHNMIKDLLPPGSIDAATSLVLVNAAYFKGLWENRFNPNMTRREVFFVRPGKEILVDMMHVEGTFRHDISETLGAHILELPYKGDNVSMFILLPPFIKTEDAIDATLKKLDIENFKKIVDRSTLSSKIVNVALPKFSLETTIELVPVLESLGVGDLFTVNADFRTLTDKKVSVGEGIHKAKIQINEDGSLAAAATTLISWRLKDEPEAMTFGNTDIMTDIFCDEMVLEYMGIGNLFKNDAELNALISGNVSLDRAQHKAKIELNEDGTKAAAATVFFSFRSSRPAEPAEFICNHPFIYLIFDKIRDAILFSGIYRGAR